MTRSVSAWIAREAWPTFRALGRSRADLESLSRSRLGWLLSEAERAPFWTERLRAARASGSGEDPYALLAKLPAVTKQDLRSAGDAAFRDGREEPGWLSSASSGSTGEPFRVCYDARAWALLKHLVKLRARWACGVGPHHRIAILDAVPPARPARGPLERAGRLRIISVLQSADAIARALVAFAPRAIYGLPSALLETASALDARGEHLAPAQIFTSGELLLPATRDALSSAFNCPIHDVYGSSETKEIAWECTEGSAHINADVVHVEALDDDGAALAPGREGNLVVTVLVNTAMPLLRYRTGDRGSLLPGDCACGRALPRLGVVTGRQVDVLELAGGRRVSPYALTCALEAIQGVVRYQVIQRDAGHLDVRAAHESGADRGVMEESIRKALRSVTLDLASVSVEFVDAFPQGPRGKFRVVQGRARGAS